MESENKKDLRSKKLKEDIEIVYINEAQDAAVREYDKYGYVNKGIVVSESVESLKMELDIMNVKYNDKELGEALTDLIKEGRLQIEISKDGIFFNQPI